MVIMEPADGGLSTIGRLPWDEVKVQKERKEENRAAFQAEGWEGTAFSSRRREKDKSLEEEQKQGNIMEGIPTRPETNTLFPSRVCATRERDYRGGAPVPGSEGCADRASNSISSMR